MSRSFTFRRVRSSIGSTVVGVVAAAALVLTSVSASAAGVHSSAGQRPVVAGSGYLALGDSVSFGYREPANLPTPDYPDREQLRRLSRGRRVVPRADPGERRVPG